MGAALTLLLLLAGSMVIVRIASVALRLTGLPDHVARFQSVSALTGAGFTTTESEAIVNFPIRRKVIVSLMILGNLGLVSVVSTFIIAFADSTGDSGAMIRQSLALAATIMFIFFVMTNKTLDRVICGFISRILQNAMESVERSYHPLLYLDDDFSVSEHVYRGVSDRDLKEILHKSTELIVLSVRGTEQKYSADFGPDFKVAMNETLVCFGSEKAHLEFARHLTKQFPFQPSVQTDT